MGNGSLRSGGAEPLESPEQFCMQDGAAEPGTSRRCQLFTASSVPHCEGSEGISAGSDFWGRWSLTARSGSLATPVARPRSSPDASYEWATQLVETSGLKCTTRHDPAELAKADQLRTTDLTTGPETHGDVGRPRRSRKLSKAHPPLQRRQSVPPEWRQPAPPLALDRPVATPARANAAPSVGRRAGPGEAEAPGSSGSPEPAPPDAPDSVVLDASMAAGVPEDALAGDAASLPRPPVGQCWDWPLTRQEKKARIFLIDRLVLMMDRQALVEELEVLRSMDSKPW